MVVVKKYKTKSKVPARGKQVSKPKSKPKGKGKQVNLRQLIRSEVNKTRGIKRLWGTQTEAAEVLPIPSGNLVPSHVFSEGTTAYATSCLNLTHQGIENEMRIGNQINPLRFTYKGYGYININTSDNTTVGQTHVRLAVGFRRQADTLNTAISNLMMEGGRSVDLTGTYQDILNPFNWKEFRPFYDKTFEIAPASSLVNNYTNPFLKNYFHFNVDYKFPPNSTLTSVESESGSVDELYNQNNIYVLFIARQMENGGAATTQTCKILATSLFQFHDA